MNCTTSTTCKTFNQFVSSASAKIAGSDSDAGLPKDQFRQGETTWDAALMPSPTKLSKDLLANWFPAKDIGEASWEPITLGSTKTTEELRGNWFPNAETAAKFLPEGESFTTAVPETDSKPVSANFVDLAAIDIPRDGAGHSFVSSEAERSWVG